MTRTPVPKGIVRLQLQAEGNAALHVRLVLHARLRALRLRRPMHAHDHAPNPQMSLLT